MTLRLDRSHAALSVRAGGLEILRYVYLPETAAAEAPKPYLHPVRTLAGDVVTGYRPHDHRWHRGVQMTASDVSGQNFWGGGSYSRGRGYVDLPNVGSMRHEEFTAIETDGERVHIAERLSWHTRAGERWVAERRALTVGQIAEGSYALEFATTLRNERGADLEFGSPTTGGRPLAGYTGLFWRGPRSFTGGEILAAGGGSGPEMMGRPARWLAFVGRHDEVDRSSTLLFVDRAERTRWFVRAEPFAAVNPSFAFHDTVALAPGDSLDLRHRIVVADAAWDRDRLESYVEGHPW